MTFERKSTFPTPQDVLTIARNSSATGRWKLLHDEVHATSICVFGALGSRYSVLGIHRGSITPGIAGRNGEWSLSDSWNRAVQVRFRLQWALDLDEKGQIILCGREIPPAFVGSA